MTVQSKETCLGASREGFLEEVQFELNLRRGVLDHENKEENFREWDCYEQRPRDGKNPRNI